MVNKTCIEDAEGVFCDESPAMVAEDPHTRIFMPRPEDMLDPLAINPAFMPIVLTHAFIFIFGVIGNCVVIATWAGSKPSRSPTCTFLVSLAVADLLLLLIYVPLETLKYFVITWDAGGAVCKLSSYVEMLSAMASVLNLTAVSIERFLVIAFPILARQYCTISTCRKGLVAVWVLALGFALPVLITKRVYAITYYNNHTDITAYYCWDANDDVAFNVAVYQLVMIFVLPALLMTVCYFWVIRELWSSTKTVAAMTRPTCDDMDKDNCTRVRNVMNFSCTRQQRAPRSRVCSIHRQGLEIQHARKQVIKMLLLVILLFLVCWGPRLFMHVAIKRGLDTFNNHIYNLRVSVYLLSFAHSSFNPVIYGFMSSNFRRMMMQSCSSRIGGGARHVSCVRCSSKKDVDELDEEAEMPPRRNMSDSYEFSTLTTSVKRSKLANSINADDSKLRKAEEQWTAV